MIETLDGVEKDRKCFRMVGGVLVERKVGEVEPALIGNRDKVIRVRFLLHSRYMLNVANLLMCTLAQS